MRGIRTFAVVITLLTVPLVGIGSAQPGDDPLAGLKNACVQSGNDNPCEKAGVIQNETVEDGETKTYEDGNFTAEGTVVVEDGGTVVVDDATITFKDTSDGFIVKSGGTLQITESTFQEDAEGSDYGIDAQAGSSLVLTTSSILGGSGVDLATSDAEVSANRFEEIPLALHLLEVTVNVTGNHFVNNNVAVNETGGAPTLHQNLFEGGQTCVRNWRTNPNITSNTFRGCHVGIFHEQSHSDITDNDMEDEIEPPGAGIIVKDTLSPNILNNRIGRYGTGILVLDGRAFIRENTLFENVAAGVRVVSNSGPMDIRDNHIFGNGGEGILLEDTQDVELSGNDIHDNNGTGAHLVEAFGSRVVGNSFSNHAVQLNLTGGDPLVEANQFTGGDFCMRNWRTNPNITSNTFRGCHVGIFHEQSHSEITDNDMEDEIEPPGAGIWVFDTESPVIENNRIAKYGVGVLVQDARAFVRGNTMTENVGAGVSVLRNSAPMDITDNHIFANSGEGIVLKDTHDVEISGNDIHDNGGTGAFLIESFGAELRGNSFSNHTVQVNLTGGDPLVISNQFTGGEFCMRNWRTNPNITSNTFRGCHVGIYHKESHSEITDNDMEDEIEPPGAGIIVEDTLSPLIKNNRIAKYGVGVLVKDARAFVRNNTVSENVAAGVHVIRNSAPMDITGNHIFGNGGEGIVLEDTENVTVADNDVHDNGGTGAFASHTSGTLFSNNAFSNQTVQLNLTGIGAVGPVVEANSFSGGAFCIRNWQTNPSIIGNTMRGCHVGIFHEQSHSEITDNDMEDEIEPPGAGIWVFDTESPVIENNRIAKYGVGVLVQDARAFVRGNTMTENVGAGVSVLRNSAPMDITDNHIFANSGEGIVLKDTHDVEISGNDIHDNGGLGAHVIDAIGTQLIANSFSNHTVQLNLTGAPAVPRIDEGSSPVAEPNLRRLGLGVVESIADDCVVYDVQGDGVTNNDIRLTPCLGKAAGTLVVDSDTAEKGAGTSTPGPDAFAFLYADVNANARYDLGDYVYLVVHESGNETPTELRAPSGSGGSFDYTVRLTPAGGHPAGSFVFAGDSDFVTFGNMVEPLPVEFGFSDHDESNAFGVGDDAFLTNGAVAPGGEVPANSLVLHGADAFGTQTDPDEGGPLVQANSFTGGDFCIRNWRTNPTIVGNTFRGCHVGIFHEQSHSDITDNDMEDEIEPPGAGIWVFDTESPVIENNRIARYGVGILVEDARAFIRNNEILENVDDGIRVVRNSGPMDIQGNDIHHNGGNGIEFDRAVDVLVGGNTIHNNTHNGLFANAVGLVFSDNVVADNGHSGAFLNDAPGASVMRNNASANGHRGITVGIAAHDTTLRGNVATGNDHEGFFLLGARTRAEDNVAMGNQEAGIWVKEFGSDTTMRRNFATNNGGHGIVVQADGLVLEENNASANGFDGILVGSAVSDTTLRGNVATGNNDDGFSLLGPRTSAEDNVAMGNQEAGIVVGNGASDTTLRRNVATKNGHDGIQAFADGLVLEENNASANGLRGIVVGSGSDVTLRRNVATGNNVEGFLLLFGPRTSAEDNVAIGNQGAGIKVESGASDATLRRNVATNNVGNGIQAFADGLVLEENNASANDGSGITVFGDNASLARNVAVGNGIHGFRIGNAVGVTSSQDSATGNGIFGFHVSRSDVVSLVGIDALDNRNGVFLGFGGSYHVVGANASNNLFSGFKITDDGFPTQVNLSFVRAFSNDDGVSTTLSSPNTTVEARDGWYEGNAGAGVRNGNAGAPNVVIDARNSYWGSPNGPTHPDNPGGDGDAVIGDVLFEPFRTSPPAEG